MDDIPAASYPVVYTPDYSYILQRLRVRPGDHIIEAGAGTQAAALEVDEENAVGMPKKRKRKTRTGGVYSFDTTSRAPVNSKPKSQTTASPH
ncbi:tRNA methyltransferase complex GCD14 protein [Pyrenophora tritici-repentis]|nr:tRNA methyltransferase complex GCD14 protein [Pyrenophora tritici-repentis]